MRRVLGTLGALLCAANCGGAGGTAPVAAPRFPVEAPADFYAAPYPSALHWPDGRIHGFPNPLGLRILDELAAMVGELGPGAPLVAGIVLVFAREPDRSVWPRDETSTTAPDAPFGLLDLETGRRVPLVWWYDRRGGTYHPPNLWRVMPAWGEVLRPRTRYLFFVREGAGVERSAIQDALLRGEAPEGPLGERAATLFRTYLDEAAAWGLAAEELAFALPFETGDPAAGLREPFAAILSEPPPRHWRDLRRTRELERLCLLEGELSLPQYQVGTPPYYPDGGTLVTDIGGRPRPQRWAWVPVAIAMPKGRMPATGWPLFWFIHGTAGLSTQLLDRGRTEHPGGHPTPNRGPAWWLAGYGIATAGAALPVNPQRTPEALGWGFYNVFNPRAVRDNFRQGALEQALVLRAILELALAPELCPGSDASAAPDGRLRFASDRIVAMGQSLGSIELGLWAPFEPLVGAIVPSGAGGFYGLMFPTSHNLPGEAILRWLTEVAPVEALTPFHPLLFLLQAALEPVDPVVLAPLVLRRPIASGYAKHVYMPAGYVDDFFLPSSIAALVRALGLERSGELVDASLAEMAVRSYPVTANVLTPDGPRLGVVVQYAADGILDGHHVSYQLEAPRHQYTCFAATYLWSGEPVVPAPEAPCPVTGL